MKDITNPKASANSNTSTFIDPETGIKINFDKGVKGKNGFRTIDH